MTKKTMFALLTVMVVALVATACVAPPPMTGAASQPAAPGETPTMTAPDDAEAQPIAETPVATAPGRGGMGMGQGMGGMMARHHAAVPEEYASLQSSVAADEASLARGAALYAANCITCHGDTGMGEGSTGASLDPSPAPIAHTSQMLSDGYLFWRITEGGAHFGTAMPVWGDALEPEARWDLINYVRNMSNVVVRGGGNGPGPMAGEGEHRAEMLAAAVEQGVITAEDAVFFEEVHAVLDEHYMQAGVEMEGMGSGGMMTMQRAMTGQAVRDGYISQADADRFTQIHDTLIEAGLMQ